MPTCPRCDLYIPNPADAVVISGGEHAGQRRHRSCFDTGPVRVRSMVGICGFCDENEATTTVLTTGDAQEPACEDCAQGGGGMDEESYAFVA